MECDETDNAGEKSIDESGAVVNSVILDYYKKFGRKRDLEQFFSLSSAETEVRDVTSLFWRRMKSQSDSSDSGEKKSKSESSNELCRISIKCTLPEPSSSSQDETVKTKSDSESPPIIVEEAPSRHSDDESVNDDNQSQNDDNQSQKSIDNFLDTSGYKPLSPTSSVTSQRKLEWDSLADVGYANESDRKTSASSLSTLERLALKQQYTNNDSKENEDLGIPTAHSTLMDVNEKSKGKKGGAKKTTRIYKKDVDVVEVSVPQGSDKSPSQAINVNLTKHISFNMEKDGAISLDNIKKDINVTPENLPRIPEGTTYIKTDKESQTTLPKTKEKSVSPEITNQPTPHTCCPRIPVLINLNTLRKKYRKKKLKERRRRKSRNKKKTTDDKENSLPVQEKSTEQVSAAESFEYMPGHVYNQNQMILEQPRTINMAGNKSSLESSTAVNTTESSKDSKHSFTKDLEKSIELLNAALRRSNNDPELKSKLIKQVVQRLLKSRYRDDESSTDFLSGLSFSSKKLGDQHTTTTNSTSDSNHTEVKASRPRKSILRSDKFNPNILASTSQSAPNLPAVSNSEKPISKIKNPKANLTESSMSSGGKNSSETAFGKASSGELYQKYLEALKREEAYKKHLRDKEQFLKQKLVCSDSVQTVPQPSAKINNKLKDLIKDLTRNNYDDGSGDASKLEGGSNSNSDFNRYNVIRKQRSHSVFTLSSGNSDDPNRKANLKKKLQNEIKESQANAHSKQEQPHQCCCTRQFIASKVGIADSSVQVDLRNMSNEGSLERRMQQAQVNCDSRGSSRSSPRNIAHVVPDDMTGDIQYVCLCKKPVSQREVPDNMLIYKCSRLTDRGVQLDNTESKTSNTVGVQCAGNCQCASKIEINNSLPKPSKVLPYEAKGLKTCPCSNSENASDVDKMSKTSQTNLGMKMLQRKSSELSCASSSSAGKKTRETSPKSIDTNVNDIPNKIIVHEATRSVQTEISFDPRIDDPSLTDIIIIKDEDCVQLINERFKEVSKRGSEVDIKSAKINDITKPDSGSEGSAKILRSGHEQTDQLLKDRDARCFKKVDKEIQSDVELNNNEVQVNMYQPNNNDKIDNFTIPIQGTNMTLMVRIGSNGNNAGETKNDDFATQCVGTDCVNIGEKATSLREECSKGVQSQTTDIFSSIYKDIETSPRVIDDNPSILSKKDAIDTFNKHCFVNTCTGENSSRSTYPRNVQINPKPLLRSNTDTGKFVSGCCVQTDDIEKNDAETKAQPSHISQKSKETDSDEAKSKCSSEKSCKPESNKEEKAESDQGRKESTSEAPSRKSSSEGEKDPILEIIRDITKRYSKKDIDRSKKKKCFKEIVTVLNYLLDTEDGTSTDIEQLKLSDSSNSREVPIPKKVKEEQPICCDQKTQISRVDKAVQLSPKKSKPSKRSTESSEIQATTDLPGTSTDSATCKVLSKIKRECEKYHQKRCKSHGTKKCDVSSSTSVNCEQCRRVHHCACRAHRCHKSKSSGDKLKKKCVAYNLIIQTSDSMISEETVCNDPCKPLKNIVVKVPPKRKHMEKVPFNEVSAKIEKNMPRCSPRGDARMHRSRSCPNDSEISSSIDEFARRHCGYTVREYLEKNRPDFLEKTTNRQQCLKIISEKRANERATHRQLLSAQLDRQPTVTALSEAELCRLARDLGLQLRAKKLAPKFINEREMKKHSEKIYKSLPEVVQKKEEVKKENIKKTNLLMANIFKKNLQKKTLRGSVNISNYSAVIKI